jgi:hypothetical protein
LFAPGSTSANTYENNTDLSLKSVTSTPDVLAGYQWGKNERFDGAAGIYLRTEPGSLQNVQVAAGVGLLISWML